MTPRFTSSTTLLSLTAALLLLDPGACLADTPPDATKPVAPTTLPATPITLHYKDAPAETVLADFAKQIGLGRGVRRRKG